MKRATTHKISMSLYIMVKIKLANRNLNLLFALIFVCLRLARK